MLKQVRKIVYIIAFAAGTWAYAGIQPFTAIPLHTRYGVLAVIFLYLALLASPLSLAFPNFPYKVIHLKARKAFGLSSFFFALIHGVTATYNVFGGPTAFLTLQIKKIWPYLFGVVALTIMTAMALTSTSRAINKLGKYWKRLHRFVYLAGTLIILHMSVIRGSYSFPFVVNAAGFTLLGFLITLQSLRFNKFVSSRSGVLQKSIFWPYLAILTMATVYFLGN